MNLSRINNTDLVEIVNSNLNKRSLKLKDVDYLNKMGIFKPFKERKSYEEFSIECVRNLIESDTYGMIAFEKMNEINNNIKLVNSVKKKFSLEDVDQYIFSTEDFKTTLNNIGKTILMALKKLGFTISNFLKTIAQFGNSITLKKVMSVYTAERAKEKIDPQKGSVIKVKVPAKPFISIFSNYSNEMVTFFNKLEKLTETVKRFIEDDSVDRSFNLKEMFAELLEDMKIISSFKHEDIPVKEIVNKLVYNSKESKVVEMTSGKFLSDPVSSLSNLNPSLIKQVTTYSTYSKKALFAINLSVKIVDLLMDKASKKSKQLDGDKYYEFLNKIRKGLRIINTERMYYAKGVAIQIGLHSEYIKYLKNIYKAAKNYFK